MKSGFVAVAGRPNVGKSTLVNALVGGKVAIVSDKPQTTRRRIAAVVNGDGYQLVLTDLPGFQRPRDALTERKQRTVDASLEDVDAHLLVLAADETIGAGDRFVAERLFASGSPVVIALNKVDQLRPERIAEQIQVAAGLGDFHALHPISAARNEGVAAAAHAILTFTDDDVVAPPGWLATLVGALIESGERTVVSEVRLASGTSDEDVQLLAKQPY